MTQRRYLTYQYKAHIKRGDYSRLDEALQHCATLYNAALEERTQAYRMQRKAVTLYDQTRQLKLIRQDMPEWSAYHYKLGAGVLVRVDRAMKAFFKRVGKRREARLSPLPVQASLPDAGGVGGDDRHAQALAGRTQSLRQDKRTAHTDAEDEATSSRRQAEDADDLAQGHRLCREHGVCCGVSCATRVQCQVGIDVGVNERLTLSTGETVERRCTTGAGRGGFAGGWRGPRREVYLGARRSGSLSRETYRNTIRNRNVCHRVSTGLVRRFGRIAVEDLQIRNMVRSAAGTAEEPGKNVAQKSGLNRSINDRLGASWFRSLPTKQSTLAGSWSRWTPHIRAGLVPVAA